jgi:hypothetical protein
MTETGQESLSQDKSPKTPFWPEWNLDLHKIANARFLAASLETRYSLRSTSDIPV